MLRIPRLASFLMLSLSVVMAIGWQAQAQFGVVYAYPLSAPNFQSGQTEVMTVSGYYALPPALFTGMVRVPAGQERLTIQVNTATFPCTPDIYIAKNRVMVLNYGPTDIIDWIASGYDYGPGAPGNGGPTTTVFSPPAGDYYFAPAFTYNVVECWPIQAQFSVTAEYFPFPPKIVTLAVNPTTGLVVQGQAASLSVVAHGENPAYQWQKRSASSSTITPIFGAVAPAYSISGVSQSDAGDYRVIVSNSGGSVTSSWATLTVILPPAITSQPGPQAAMPGSAAHFSVTASGTAPFTYQWYHRDLTGIGRPISGANAATLNLSGVSYPGDAGNYYVVVMNSANPVGVQSRDAVLTIGPGGISVSPLNLSVNEGQSITLNATATGTGPLVYNWLHNGVLQTSGPTLAISAAHEADDGPWELDVTNQVGKASHFFTLNVIPPPTPPSFLILPSSATVTEGEPFSLTSWAVGTRPLSYQWITNSVPMQDATNGTLLVAQAGPEDAGQWSVLVANSLGQTSSPPVTVTVLTGPKILQQPQNQVVAPSNAVTLSVAAVGRQPLSYQWFKNGVQIDQVGPQLTITNASPADAGFYRVAVTNGLGEWIMSATARLLVQPGAASPGSLLWRTAVPVSGPMVIREDGTIVFVGTNGLVAAIRADGSPLWTTNVGRWQLMAAPGNIAIVASGLGVAALNPDGSYAWSHGPTTPLPDTPAFPWYGASLVPAGPSKILWVGLGITNEVIVMKSWQGATIDYWFGNSQWGRFEVSPVTFIFQSSLDLADGASESTLTNSFYFDDLFETSEGMAPTNSQGLSQDLSELLVPIGESFAVDTDGVLAQEVHKGTLQGRWSLEWLVTAAGAVAMQYPGAPYGSAIRPQIMGIGPDNSAYVSGFISRRLFEPPVLGLYRFEAGSIVGPSPYASPYPSAIAVRSDGGYFSGDGFGGLVAVSKDFQLDWTFTNASFTVLGSAPTLAGDGTVYVSAVSRSTPGQMALLAIGSSGQLLWQFSPPVGESSVGSPVIAADGTVYFGTDHALYALQGSAPILESTWPCYAGNVRGTWRVQQLPTVPAVGSRAVLRGDVVAFDGTSSGPQPIAYQWLKNGAYLLNATNAVLSVTNLLGFDSGAYQVRVSNPTGDKLSQPAHLKVSFDPQLLAGVTNVSDAGFTNALPSANTARDAWQFFYGINETNRDGNYSRMQSFTTNWISGVPTWFAGIAPTGEAVGRNMTTLTTSAFNGYLPSGAMFMHPGPDPTSCVGLGFQAEATGLYSVTGLLSLLSPDWDGFGNRWYLDVGSINVASGALTNGPPACNCGVTNSAFSSSVYLQRGDYLYLIIGPGGSGGSSDLHMSGVQLSVALVDPDSNSEPGILQSPQDLTVVQGQNASFSAWVDGEPAPALQWQLSTNNGATWLDLVEDVDGTGTTSTNLQLYGATLDMSGWMYRVEAINASGSSVSGAATLTVVEGTSVPSLVTQPQGLTLAGGGPAILSAGASGAGPLTYQWWKNGQALSGQTNATLNLSSTGTNDSGTYFVVVSNFAGSVTSQVAVLTVGLPPSPSLALASTTNGMLVGLSGAPATQWRVQRAQPLASPWQSLSLVTLNSQGSGSMLDTNPPSDAGFYRASYALSTTVPRILTQPLSWSFQQGSQASFNVGVEGAEPLSYQWRKDGATIPSATASTLIIPGVVSNSAGNYSVVVTNMYGTVTSQVAVLTVSPPPNYQQVTDIVATATSEIAALNRYASNAVNGIYADPKPWESVGVGNPQWGPDDRSPAITFDLRGVYRLVNFTIWNGSEIANGVKRMILEYSLDGQTYQSFGEIDLAQGTGTQDPSDVIDLQGLQARFIRFDILENYEGAVFPFVGPNSGSVFYTLVQIEEVSFAGELLSVGLPRIFTQPTGVTNAPAGVTWTFSVGADGIGPLSYQWYKDGAPLANATNTSLSFSPISFTNAGTYTVVVSNAAGEIVSAPTTLTVTTNISIVPGLLAYFPFNGNTLDHSGNGKNGIMVGASFGTNGHGYATSLSVDNQKYVTVGDIDPDVYTNGFSFGGWVRLDPGPGNTFLYWGSTYILLNAPGSVLVTGAVSVRLGSGNPDTSHDYLAVPSLTLDQWIHLFVTHGPTVDRLYVNGQQSGEWPSRPLAGNVSTLDVGLDTPMSINDVAIFARELNAHDVTVLYNSGVPLLQPLLLSVQPSASSGSFAFKAAGRPGSTWTLQRAPSPIGDWTNIGSFTLNTNGTAQVQDTNPPAASGFYRARQP